MPPERDESPAIERLERQMAKLTDVVTQLVRIDERQAQHSHRLDTVEEEQKTQREAIQKNKDEVAKWVNRGMGLWGAAMLLWALFNSPAVQSRLSGG